jgi:hypothetical protein
MALLSISTSERRTTAVDPAGDFRTDIRDGSHVYDRRPGLHLEISPTSKGQSIDPAKAAIQSAVGRLVITVECKSHSDAVSERCWCQL